MALKKICFLVLISLPFFCYSQSNDRENFKQSFWEEYVGVYSAEDSSILLISLTWGDKLEYTNLKTSQLLSVSSKTSKLFNSGDSVKIDFQSDQSDSVTALELKQNNKHLHATKLPIRFEQLSIPSGDHNISGTLIKPGGIGPFPVIIINGGASWIVRDTNLNEALFYVSEGLAAFVYDKRGWGESTGQKTVPFQKSADDINYIAEFLKLRMDINPENIGISTYSQSGWYGTLASSQSNVISFQILNVPAATTVHRQERQRVEYELTIDGFKNTEVEEALELFDLMSAYSTTGKNWDKYFGLREEHKDKKWFKYLFAPKDNSQQTWEWGRMNWMYNPLPALIKTSIPTLIILGEKDRKVLAEVNRSIFEEAFDLAGNTDYKIQIIPNMNHSLELAYKGGRKEPSNNLYAPLVFKIKKEWLGKVLSGG